MRQQRWHALQGRSAAATPAPFSLRRGGQLCGIQRMVAPCAALLVLIQQRAGQSHLKFTQAAGWREPCPGGKSRHRDSECRVQAAETDAEISLSPGQSTPCPRIPRHWTVPTAGQSAASSANHGTSRCFAVAPQLHEIAGKHPASRSPSLESATESDTGGHANQTQNFKCDCPAAKVHMRGADDTTDHRPACTGTGALGRGASPVLQRATC